MKYLKLLIFCGLASACSNEPSIESFVTACPGESGKLGKSIICMGGDKILIGQIPDFGTVPEGVILTSSTLTKEGDQKGVGYAGTFEGPMSDIKPAYDKIISSNPKLKGKFQSPKLFGIFIKDDQKGSYISLTEMQTTRGQKFVNVLAWRAY